MGNNKKKKKKVWIKEDLNYAELRNKYRYYQRQYIHASNDLIYTNNKKSAECDGLIMQACTEILKEIKEKLTNIDNMNAGGI